MIDHSVVSRRRLQAGGAREEPATFRCLPVRERSDDRS
jgi:hypothetical protein